VSRWRRIGRVVAMAVSPAGSRGSPALGSRPETTSDPSSCNGKLSRFGEAAAGVVLLELDALGAEAVGALRRPAYRRRTEVWGGSR